MSAITTIEAPPRGELRQVFRVGWDIYKAMCEGRGERSPVRLAYDGKDLEIMTIGYVHEHLRELLIHIITAVASWSGIRHMPCGQATWQSAPDQSDHEDPTPPGGPDSPQGSAPRCSGKEPITMFALE